MTEPTVTMIEVVYTGICELEGGGAGVVLHQLAHGDLGEKLVFDRKKFTGVIGGIYSIEQTGPQTFRIADKRFVRMFSDGGQVAAWQIDVKSRQLREDANKAEKKAKDAAPIFELLEPIRAEYRKALPDRRRVIEIMLLDYLRR